MNRAQYLYSSLYVVCAHNNIVLTMSTFSVSEKLLLQDAFSWPVEQLPDALLSTCMSPKPLQLFDVHTSPPHLTGCRAWIMCTSLGEHSLEVSNSVVEWFLDWRDMESSPLRLHSRLL